MATDKTADKPIKLPKTLAGCADRLYEVRQLRLAKQREVEAFEKEESALREHLIQNLPKSQASGIAGKTARASIANKVVVQVTNWDEVYGYIVKNFKKNPGVFALLQKRVGEAAVKEIWEAGKKVPGTQPLEVPTVSLNKL